MKDNEMRMEALSLDELKMVSGGVGELDEPTIGILELIGDIVDWFSNL